MKVNTYPQKIKETLERGVENIYPSSKDLEEVLKSGRKIRLYGGIDPTGKLHLGHLVILKKLRHFQDLGHDVIVLIGDFTATIGDPTGKAAARKALTRKQVLENAKNYKKIIGKVLDLKKANVRFMHNEKWTSKLRPIDMLELASQFKVARLLERDMFQKRIQEGKDILLSEFLYPIFQAYDSVTMDVDLEVGGNDQMFNMMRGRELMKKMKNKEKFVLTTKLLTDPQGKKMGKTEGNFIALDDSPEEMFGKIMSWPDSMIKSGFELLTGIKDEKIREFLQNPRRAKAALAKEVIKIFHSRKEADSAENEFNSVFRRGEVPLGIPEIAIKERVLSILDLLVAAGLTASKSEAKRAIEQGGVKIDNEAQMDWKRTVEIKKETVIQVGKRKFAKIK